MLAFKFKLFFNSFRFFWQGSCAVNFVWTGRDPTGTAAQHSDATKGKRSPLDACTVVMQFSQSQQKGEKGSQPPSMGFPGGLCCVPSPHLRPPKAASGPYLKDILRGQGGRVGVANDPFVGGAVLLFPGLEELRQRAPHDAWRAATLAPAARPRRTLFPDPARRSAPARGTRNHQGRQSLAVETGGKLSGAGETCVSQVELVSFAVPLPEVEKRQSRAPACLRKTRSRPPSGGLLCRHLTAVHEIAARARHAGLLAPPSRMLRRLSATQSSPPGVHGAGEEARVSARGSQRW